MKKSKRHLALVSSFILSALTARADVIMTFDTSGPNAKPAVNGIDYTGYQAAPGTAGLNGGDGSPAGNGGNAGNMNLLLSSGAANGTFIITGAVGGSNVNQTLPIGTSGYVYLTANGGAGANGANGGNGEAGGVGTPAGQDADQADQNATDGADGAPGGAGGNASSGGAGGNAGEIRITLHPNDTHLLMLIRTNKAAGPGGRAGVNGAGGAGGAGAPGGNGISWTENEITGYQTVQVPQTDSDGGIVYQQVQATGDDGTPQVDESGAPVMVNSTDPVMVDQQQPVYEAVPHSKAAGNDGQAGPNGEDGDARLADGPNGVDGRYRLFLQQPNGQPAEFQSRYDLQVTGYTIVPKAGSTVIEPGDTVTISNIRVKNVGGMPTPQMQALFNIVNSNWLIGNSQALPLPSGILPSQEVTLPGTFTFVVQSNVLTGQPGAVKTVGTIVPTLLMTGSNRLFENPQGVQSFEISYPVKITGARMVAPATPGGQARMQFQITNTSNQDLGSQSGLKRKLMAHIQLPGGQALNADHVLMMDAKGNLVPGDRGVMTQIPLLHAGESTTVSVPMQIHPQAHIGAKGKFTLSVHVSHPKDLHDPLLMHSTQVGARVRAPAIPVSCSALFN